MDEGKEKYNNAKYWNMFVEIADTNADKKRKKDGEAMLSEEEYYPIDFDDLESVQLSE